ncbi:MAG: NAD(P)H-quinone oxidoreductase [Acidobacteriota bacterium]
MKAIVVVDPGESSVLEIRERPDAVVDAGNLRIRVAAAGLNRADLLQRRGQYPPPPGTDPSVPGLEIAGQVILSRDASGRFREGDRVMALLPGEGYAQEAVVPSALCMPVPENLTFEEAASVPEVFLTAYDALFRQIDLRLGETLLVHAAGSGVGTAAIQLAAAAGVRIIGTSRSRAKLERAAGLGLNEGLVPGETEDLVESVRRRTGGQGVDAILDLVGTAYWPQNLEILRSLGRIMVVGLVSGRKTEVDLGILLRKRLRIYGTALRSRSLVEKAALIEEFSARVLPLFRSGRIRPVVDRVFPWTQTEEAHRHLESNDSFGKVVLAIS